MARPNLSYLKNVALTFTGLFCGVLTGLTVALGSVASLPAVSYLLGLRPGRANATALATTFFGAFGGILSYQQLHKVNWGVAVALALTQILGVSWAERRLATLRTIPSLRILWTLVTIAGGLAIAACTTPVMELASTSWHAPLMQPMLSRVLWVIAVGVAVGILSQVMELAGVLVVPAALLLLHMDPLLAQGTALAGLMMVSASGFLIYVSAGEVETQSAGWMSFGAWLGGLIGAYMATRVLAPPKLVLIYGISLALIGLIRFMTVSGNRGRPTAPPAAPDT